MLFNYESFYRNEKYYHSIRNSRHDYFSYKKTVLFLDVEKENYEIVKLLLSNKNVNVNCSYSFSEDQDNRYKKIKNPLKRLLKICLLVIHNFLRYLNIFEY